MKKLALTAILSVFLTIFLVSSVLAVDVAYVVKTTADPILKSELSSVGLTYDVIYESNITSTNFSKYKMLLVGDDNFGNFESIPVEKYNSLIINSYHFYQKGIFIISDSQWGWSGGRGSATSPTNIRFNIIDTTLSDGVPESFKAYTVQDVSINAYYLTGKKATGVKLVTRIDGHATSDSALALAYPGTVYLNGKTGEARSLFFGIVEPKYWTIESRQLFRNSLDWVLIGEDNDSDGFYSDEDCDDTNVGINPDAEDIAYDGIDQDCSGYDLGDVDADNYCKEGYSIQNASVQCPNEVGTTGKDCNDDDFSEKPGSSNLSLNCVNDAPIVSNPPNFIIRESQVVTLSVTASDPENDSLSYYINDSKFTQSSANVFQWQTGFYDAGNHTFAVNVGDGQLNSTKSFKVEVKEKNQAPVLNTTIPSQTWNEDTNFSLNLSDYFEELDPSDNVTYGVSKTSTDLNISVESVIGGIVNFIVKRDWSGLDWIVFFAYDGKDKTESNNVTLIVSAVNDAPVLATAVPNQTWNEDTSLTLDLGSYFKDVDSVLTYSATGNSQININITGSNAKLTPANDWNGKETILFNAGDGEFNTLSNEVTLTVSSVNDAPVLNLISDELVLAGSLIDINPSATDVDGDTLGFTFGSQLDNEGKWQTSGQDAGVYKITASVSDGNGGSDSQIFNLQILQKFYINEFTPNPTTGNEWIELYNGFNQIINLSNCVVKDGANNIFALNGTLGKNQFAIVEMNNKLDNLGDILILSCSDKLIDSVSYGNWDDGSLGDNAELPGLGESSSRNPDGLDTNNNLQDFEIFKYPTKGLPSNTDMAAPDVRLSNPSDNSLFTESRDITFEFTVNDNMAQTLECEVYLDGILKATDSNVKNSTVENITINKIPDGDYDWNIRCYDQRNYAFSQDNRTLTISAPDNPVLNSIGQKSVNENETLEFTVSATDQDLDSVSFSVQNGPQGISFLDNFDGTALFSWVPTYEQAGSYNVTFIARDASGLIGQEVVKINVNDKRIPPKFSDVDRCEVENQKLQVSITNPDDNDEFEVGEDVDVKVEIKNNHSEDLDVDLKVYLYDIDEEEAIESEKDSSNIDSGKDRDFRFSLKIPEDVKNSDFAIFVLAEGENVETLCNEEYKYIDVQRREHEISIKEVVISSDSIFPGNIFDVVVEMQNTGSEDEDVHVEIRSSELGVLKKTEKFELERFGDDDEETKTFGIQIPKTAQEGDYSLEIRIVADETEDSTTETISVLRQEGIIQEDNVIYSKEPKQEPAKQSKGLIYLALNLFLLMLVVVFVSIFRFVRGK